VICPYYENKLGAISITFDDVDYNQYLYAQPLLNKYHLKANFGVVQDWIKEHPTFIAEEGGFALKRMGVEQIREIVSNGHEISFHGGKHQSYQSRNEQEIETELIQRKKEMEELFNTKISVVHYPYPQQVHLLLRQQKKQVFFSVVLEIHPSLTIKP
jgi:peptidoglycan/xylan/chitin deacetylase (PgdA/CDA1 family)